MLIITFFLLTLYNVPVVLTGIWQILKSHKKKVKFTDCTEKDLPIVSIIVPVKNEEKVIGRLLNALLSLNYPSCKREIIVVNDASTDRTGKICEGFSLAHPEIKVVEKETSSTKAAALNFGFGCARGDVVATFDADSVPEPDSILKVAKYFGDSSVAAVQGRICSINSGQNMMTQFISYEWAVQYELYMGGKDALGLYVGLAGTCQFIRKDVLEAIGGWNENCLAEDTELSVRLVEKGHTIRYASEVRTFEESPFSIKGLMAQRARWYRGNIETGLRFGRLMKRPNLRRIDAEITLLSTWMILLCVVNYFAPLWAFSAPSIFVFSMIVQFTSLFTLLLLAVVGVSLVCLSGPFRLRNVLWLPFIYAYWGFQSFIALFALFEVATRRKLLWRKTEHSGKVTVKPEVRV